MRRLRSTELWGVNAAIAADMVAVFAILATFQHYPDALGYMAPSSKPLCASGGQARQQDVAEREAL